LHLTRILVKLARQFAVKSAYCTPKGVVDMIMSRIWTAAVFLSLAAALFSGNGWALSESILKGAQNGVTLAISMTGAICLWSGVGKLMEHTGITMVLARLFRPMLHRIFPSCKDDTVLAGHLSSNFCANLLGLGNAATPMGIAAVRRMRDPARPDLATHEMCRLIVLNTASIQLLPTSVAAVRVSLGCTAPFDILPAVWLTSLCSAGLGVAAAIVLGKAAGND
jgi:spore maturation protein A